MTSLTDPAVIGALSVAAGMVLSEARQAVFGGRQSKAQLSEVEQRIAATLLEAVEKRLAGAEKRIAELEREVRALQTERNGLTQRIHDLERDLAVVTAERDQLKSERDDMLDRISKLHPRGDP